MLRPGTGTLMRDTESQGQVRNYQVLTHLSGGPNMCPALAAQPPLFPAYFHSLVSCLLVSSVNHQTSFQYIPFGVSQAWLVAVT